MDDRDRVLLAIRCNDETGLRLSDVLGLPREAFRAREGLLEARFAEGGRETRRAFRLSRLLRVGLVRMLEEASPSGALLFTDAGGVSFTSERVRALWTGGSAAVPGAPGRAGLAALWAGDAASGYIAAREAGVVGRALAEALAGRPRPRLLEVGCAYGQILRKLHREVLAPVGGISLGIDRVPELVRQAAGTGPAPGLTWLAGDARRLPLKDGSVDALLAVEVLEHLPIPEVFLEEAARCLRPGGVFVATTPNPEGAFVRLARLRRWAQSFGPEGGLRRLREGYQPMVDPQETEKAVVYGHVSMHSPGFWQRAFSEAGLTLRSVRAVTLAAPHLLFARRPWALAALKGADAVLTRLSGAARFCTGVCYAAVKPG